MSGEHKTESEREPTKDVGPQNDVEQGSEKREEQGQETARSEKKAKTKLEELDILLEAKKPSGNVVIGLVTGLNTKEGAELLADAQRMEKMASALGKAHIQQVYTVIKAPIPLRVQTALEAKKVDQKSVKWLILKGTKAEHQKIADSLYILQLLIKKVGKKRRHKSMDLLVDSATQIGSIQVMFEDRFGVKVGSQNRQQALDFLQSVSNGVEGNWGPKGLKRVYHVMRRLPPKHVKRLKNLLTDNSSSGGVASGVASAGPRVLSVSYDESKVDDVESGAFTQDGDKMRGMNTLDTTTAHELSHVVDKKQKYSGKKSFLKISGWKHHNGSKKIVKAIKANMATPVPDTLTSDEKKAANKAAEISVTNRRKNTSSLRKDIKSAYEDLGLKNGGKSGKYKNTTALKNVLKTSHLFKHIGRGQSGNQAWYKEAYDYLAPQQIHEAYAGDGWYSYNNSARAKKLSIYQFRDPGEEFAELYATYHMSEKKGEKVDATRKKWFEGQKLHK